MRRSLILNILCPSGRNIIICVVVLMLFVSTLVTFLLFDDITSSSISIIYHIHSDIPHPAITDILYTNHTVNQHNHTDSANTKYKSSEFSILNIFDYGNNDIFENGKSFSQIMHDQFRPSLQNLLPSMNDTQMFLNDMNLNNHNRHNNNNINKHFQWYSSKPIPYILANKLNINKYQTVSTKLIYHPTLQHFLLIVISQCNKKNAHKWCMDIYERDAKPFLWKYAFDTKYLYQSKNKTAQNDESDSQKQTEQNKSWFGSCWEMIAYAAELIVADLKAIGFDISMGFDSLNELSHILQEIILKESTQNPSFENEGAGLIEADLLKNNIEKYIFKKSEIYQSYYDVHADKIKVVYTDWYHTYSTEINGVFNDAESLLKWSSDYQYLLINGYVDGQSELHLFEFAIMDNNNSMHRMKNDEIMKKHHLKNTKMSEELLDKLQDYGYYTSSSLDTIYGVKTHQFSNKHIAHYNNDNMYAKLTALTFSKCSIYYAVQNDYKLIRAVKLHDIFTNIHTEHCNHEENQYTDTKNAFFPARNDNTSHYEYTDSLTELTMALTRRRCADCTNEISDIQVINESTLLITQIVSHNSYYKSYTTSLVHIPFTYQHSTSCKSETSANRDRELRWYIIESRGLYRDQLNSKQYYYKHDNVGHNSNNYKSDRFGAWMSSIHPSQSQLNVKRERKKENKLHFQPSLFLSKSQDESSTVITATPYFISLNDQNTFDDTVEIVNIKPMTTFTQSALNKQGDLLAILDNTDSILVLKKKKQDIYSLSFEELAENITFNNSNATVLNSVMTQSFNEFLVKTGIKSVDSDLVLINDTMMTILSQFIRNELLEKQKEKQHEVEWKVSSEFTATSIMSHLKPLNIICIDDDTEPGIDGYVVVLFENGVISSFIIRNGESVSTDVASVSRTFFLPSGAIDFWLETCIDWIELMFLMSFGLYFVCSCCRRSRVRIGLGRERVINAVAPVAVPVAAPAAVAVPVVDVGAAVGGDAANADNVNVAPVPLVNGPWQLNGNEAVDGNGNVDGDVESEHKVDVENVNVNANERAINAALHRYLGRNGDEEKKEEKEEKEEKSDDDDGHIQFVRLFDVPSDERRSDGNEIEEASLLCPAMDADLEMID